MDSAQPITKPQWLFALTDVVVRLDHIASLIVNANDGGVRPHPAHHSGVG